MYTENKTLRELLEDPVIGGLGKDAISKWDLSKEEMYDWTVQEIADRLGWKDVGYGLERLYEIAGKGRFLFQAVFGRGMRRASVKGKRKCGFLSFG